MGYFIVLFCLPTSILSAVRAQVRLTRLPAGRLKAGEEEAGAFYKSPRPVTISRKRL